MKCTTLLKVWHQVHQKLFYLKRCVQESLDKLVIIAKLSQNRLYCKPMPFYYKPEDKLGQNLRWLESCLRDLALLLAPLKQTNHVHFYDGHPCNKA